MKKIFRHKRFLALFCVVGTLATISAVGGIAARYVTGRQDQQLVTAQEFRFESNYLKEGGANYTIYADTVSFNVANTDGLTDSEGSVTYELSISDGKLTTGTTGSHTFSGLGSETYVLDRDGANSVTVTATSTAPYSKTLAATFNFRNPEAYYTVTNRERYVQIDVYTADAVNGITVSGTGLTPDATNDLLEGMNIQELEADSHYTFVYFKDAEKTFATVGKTALTDTIILQ